VSIFVWLEPNSSVLISTWYVCYIYCINAITCCPAVQIQTGTSELKDITKMERIGTSFPSKFYYSLNEKKNRWPTLTSRVRSRRPARTRQNSQGLVGQGNSQSAGMILKLVQEGKIADVRCSLLALLDRRRIAMAWPSPWAKRTSGRGRASKEHRTSGILPSWTSLRIIQRLCELCLGQRDLESFDGVLAGRRD